MILAECKKLKTEAGNRDLLAASALLSKEGSQKHLDQDIFKDRIILFPKINSHYSSVGYVGV